MAINIVRGHSRLMPRVFPPVAVQGSGSYSDIASIDEFVSIENTYWMGPLNQSNGVYDTSRPVADLNYIAGTSKYLGFQIPFKRIGFTTGLVPAWWGGQGTAYEITTNAGGIIRLWDSSIYQKWIDTWEQLSIALTATGNIGKLAYITSSESASSLSPFPPGFSTAIWDATLRQFYTDLRDLFPDTQIVAKGLFTLVSVDAFDSYMMSIDVGIGGPDTAADINDSRHPYHVAKSAFSGANANAPIQWSVEWGNYLELYNFPANYPDPTYAGQSSANSTDYQTPDMILNYLINTSKADYICWLRRDPYWSDVVTAIQAYGPNGTDQFPPSYSEPPPVDPPASSTGFTILPVQYQLPTSGTPPVALPVGHSLPATPKFLFSMCNHANSNDTNVTGACGGFGATDFTNQWTVAIRQGTGLNPAGTAVRGMTDRCLAQLLSGSSNVDFELNDGTPDSTYINLAVEDLPSSNFLVEAFTGCGDGILRYAGVANLSTQDTPVAITATDPNTGGTFEPNVAIVVTINTTFNDSSSNHALYSYGIACVNSSSSTVQKCLMMKDENGVSPTEPAMKLHTTRVGGIINTSDAEAFTVDLAFTSTGATVTAKDASGSGAAVGVLLLQINSSDIDLVDLTFPTSTGNTNHNIGGDIDFGIIVGSILDTVDAIDTTNAFSYFISSITPATSALISKTVEDAQTSSDNRSRASLKPIQLYSQDGATKLLEASYVSQDGTNITFNYGTVPGTAYKGFMLRVASVSVLDVSSDDVTVPQVIDLTAAGYTDYVRLGSSTASGIERKSNGGNQIGVSFDTPTGRFVGGSTTYPQFSATDSAPSGSLPASAARPYWSQVGESISLTFPASAESASAYVWINVSGVDVDITVSISDGSFADYEDTLSSADTTTGNIIRKLLTVDYQAVTPGELITITAELSASNATGGNLSVSAAALTNNYTPPEDSTLPDFPFGFPRLISVTETSQGSGLYDIVYGVQLSESGEVFAQARLGTNTFDPFPDQVEAGTDGADDDTDILFHISNTDIDFLEEVPLTFEDIPEATLVFIDIAAKDSAGNYTEAAYITQVTTPSSGAGGGEGSYSVTVQLDNGAGSVTANTNVEYIWVESDDFGNGQTISGTWTPAVSGSTGLLTVQRSVTDPGHLLVRGENGEFYRSTELTPA